MRQCLYDDERRADRRADKREPGPVEEKRLAGMNDDVVGIICLRDPQDAAQTPHPQALAILDIEDLVGFEMPRPSVQGAHAPHRARMRQEMLR